MKQYLYAYAMCQSMFCAIPCPGKIWDERSKDKMLLFLPLVGLEIGVIWAVLAWQTQLLALPELAAGAALCAYPYLVTGFMHLDGFMDVTDAVKSWRDLDHRREILKDPRVGSFAVISTVLLLLAQFALFASAPQDADRWILVFIPTVSRCCSSLSISVLRPMSTSQYAGRKAGAGHIACLSIMLIAAVAGGFLFCGKYGFAVIGCLVGYALALYCGFRSLEGMNGDIAGYSLTIGELCGIAVYSLL